MIYAVTLGTRGQRQCIHHALAAGVKPAIKHEEEGRVRYQHEGKKRPNNSAGIHTLNGKRGSKKKNVEKQCKKRR